ncbi:uncharacterized protein LOC112085170 [Eutrema salsugineum]|uniref:uncharacterized protein LOC112085170 n=1 Tax=Eutrema salsugineum TaxID=72664 RepID=UPI000CED1506|nr:uncharacterized protein LOC112085170 [Eutrema salsugineum]
MTALNASKLWKKCKILRLTINMRLHIGLSESDANDISSFSKWILEIGEGKINEPNDGETKIEIPEDLLIKDCEKIVYLNADSIDPSERVVIPEDDIDTLDKDFPKDIDYPQEFLNSIKISGLPNHRLLLKIGAPIFLLRNIDPKRGLCNGIRLIVTQLANHVIEARVITGKSNSYVDEKVLIPRMFVTPADAKFPFKMRRRQFSVSLAFVMTINKSQGQTLEKV